MDTFAATLGSPVKHLMSDKPPPDQSGSFIVFDYAGYALCGRVIYNNEILPKGVETKHRLCHYCQKHISRRWWHRNE